ncbi:MAG: hypothetical protein V1676_03665 [Candidatus Diapherotrites archaeon]
MRTQCRKGFTPFTAPRGFTLFTALVAFILIVLAMLLVQAMIRAERGTTDVVSDMGEQAEMEAIADLVRADALQRFNYTIRYSIENWITQPGNQYPLTRGKLSWKDVQGEFVKSNFGEEGGGTQFANIAAYNLSSILAEAGDVRGFDISFTNNDTVKLRNSVQGIFEKSLGEETFFEVVKCPEGAYENCVGTFYVTLDLANMDDAEYEALPQITVESTLTKRVMKVPMLPRGKFRIYVPLRVFRAIAAAREIAIGSGGTEAGGYMDGDGLLGGGFHNEISGINAGQGCTSGCGGGADDPENVKTTLRGDAEGRINDWANKLAEKLKPGDGFGDFIMQGAGGLSGNRAKEVTVTAEITHTWHLQGGGEAYCAKPWDTQTKIVFRETNPEYIVSGGEGAQREYTVAITDVFDQGNPQDIYCSERG